MVPFFSALCCFAAPPADEALQRAPCSAPPRPAAPPAAPPPPYAGPLPSALRTITVHVAAYTFFDCAEKAVLPFVQLVLLEEGGAGGGEGALPLLSRARAAALGATPALRAFLRAHPCIPSTRHSGDRSRQGKAFRSAWAAVASSLPGVRYGHAGALDMAPGAGNFLASLCGLFPPLSLAVLPAARALNAPQPQLEAGLRAAAAFFSTPAKALAVVGVGVTLPVTHPRGAEQWEGFRQGLRVTCMPHASATDSTSFLTVLVNGTPWVHAHWFLRIYEPEPARDLGEEYCGHAQLFQASEGTQGRAQLELRTRDVAWLAEGAGEALPPLPEGMPPELPPDAPLEADSGAAAMTAVAPAAEAVAESAEALLPRDVPQIH